MKNVMLTLATAALLAACGGQKDEKKTDAPAEQDQGVNVATDADATTAESLPSVIVAKVPLDAEGNEIADQGEARELYTSGQIADAATAVSAFDAGNQIAITDELDADSSTSQWGGGRSAYYWSTPWYPGKLLGRGLLWGRNPYVYRGGRSYGYRYQSYYRYNNCNYYTYYPSYGNGYGGSYGYGSGGYYGNTGYYDNSGSYYGNDGSYYDNGPNQGPGQGPVQGPNQGPYQGDNDYPRKDGKPGKNGPVPPQDQDDDYVGQDGDYQGY